MQNNQLGYSLAELRNYLEVRNGMIYFNNMESFQKVVSCLHKLISCTNIRQDIDEADYVLDLFERTIGFSHSLRRHIELKIIGLMATDSLTDLNDPDDFYFPDKVIRSIVNTKLDLSVGGKVISVKEAQNEYAKLRVNELADTVKQEETVESVFKNGSGKKESEDLLIKKLTGYNLTGNPLTWSFSAEESVGVQCDNGSLVQYNWYIYKSNGELYQQILTHGPTLIVNFPEKGDYRVCVEATNGICLSPKECMMVKVVDSEEKTCCRAYAVNKGTKYYANGAGKIKTNIVFVNIFLLFYNSFVATTKNYTRINGKYKYRKASELGIVIFGKYYEFHCKGNEKEFSTGVKKKYSKKLISVTEYSFVPIWTKGNFVKSEHSVAALGDYTQDIRSIIKCK